MGEWVPAFAGMTVLLGEWVDELMGGLSGGDCCSVSMLLISFSLWNSSIVLWRLFSILRSYINRRSRTLALL